MNKIVSNHDFLLASVWIETYYLCMDTKLMQAVEIDSGDIMPLHRVMDFAKLNTLKEAIKRDGWTGRPLLVAESDDGLRALTGSHRLEAAQQLGMQIPVLLISSQEVQDAGLDADYLASTDDDDREYKLRRAGLIAAADLMAQENA